MKKINSGILLILLTSMTSLLVACSEDNDSVKSENKTSGDHVWKEQTDALKTSKDVAKKLQDSLNQQQQKLDESH
ncbi:MAG: hypothetical protein OQK75_13515 [Gammaproteobacteria bacterium]|nr:hypothetical protein [Gammaproteobacteria bacterium]MCW8988677.1 hypothetical protein [Gammaproteobacteria bacterium]